MFVNVPDVTVQQAGLQTIDIGHVAIGPITVGDLVISNTDFSLNAGHGVIKNMDIDVTLSLALEWWVGFDINRIVHVHEHHTTGLGLAPAPRPARQGHRRERHRGPRQPDLHRRLRRHPRARHREHQDRHRQPEPGQPASRDRPGGQPPARRRRRRADPGAQPAAASQGFTLAGLGIGGLNIGGFGVPAASADAITIGRVHGDATPFGQMTLSNLGLPAASMPDITSQGIDTVGTPKPKAFHLDLGCLDLTLRVNPRAEAHIDQLVITNVKASTSIGRIELHNVVAPYELLNLTLSQIGIDTLQVPSVAIA